MALTFVLNRQTIDREKLSSYECGFQPYASSQSQVYLKYFIIGLVFLIFDLESVILFPAVTMHITDTYVYVVFMSFLLVLIYGLYYEINKKLF